LQKQKKNDDVAAVELCSGHSFSMSRLSVINRLLSQPNGLNRNSELLICELKSFVDRYQTSIELSVDCEELRPLLTALPSVEIDVSVDVEIYLAKVIKILFRSPSNRKGIGKSGMISIIRSLSLHARCQRGLATGEIGNVVLNACYNGENVDLFVELGGIDPLCSLLMSSDTAIVGCILGALQGICYVPAGRFAFRRNYQVKYFLFLLIFFQALQRAATLLTHPDEIVRARAAGCVHNLSADPASIAMLREVNCIPAMICLLKEHSPEVCQAAAGTIQNMSREAASREIILRTNITPLLVDLLFSDDPKCQVSPNFLTFLIRFQVASIGALLNILGPSLDANSMDLLRETLTNGLVLGTIESCVFEPTR
jgi:hypothetical protein